MKNIEKLGTENIEEVKYDPKLASLWRKHHFRGDPPATGTESEQRLRTTCAEYARLTVLGNEHSMVPNINLDKSRQGGGEDYFAEVRANKAVDDFRRTGDVGQFRNTFGLADDRRRELHNLIVTMTIGNDRSLVDPRRAEEVTDFACEIEFGMPCQKAIDDVEKGKFVA